MVGQGRIDVLVKILWCFVNVSINAADRFYIVRGGMISSGCVRLSHVRTRLLVAHDLSTYLHYMKI